MKHSILLTLFFTLIPLIGGASDKSNEANKAIEIVCGDLKGWNQAMVIKSKTPITQEKANEFFDTRNPQVNSGLESNVYFFSSVQLSKDSSSESYKNVKRNLLSRIKSNNSIQRSGTLGNGMYTVRFRTDNFEDIKVIYQIKKNPDREVIVVINNEELYEFGGGYTCNHEIVDFEEEGEILTAKAAEDLATLDQEYPHGSLD